MGITPKDIQAQRELLERGERILEAQEQRAERARLRDTFAAAALMGMLAAPTDKDRSMEYWARLSYEAADAMLRERTNHDAVPAATARTDADRNRTDKAALRPGKGAGNTHPMQPTPGECSLRNGCASGRETVR